MPYKVIRRPDTHDSRRISVFRHKFRHGAAKSAVAHTVLHRDDTFETLACLVQDRFIQRFEENHIIMSHRRAAFPDPVDRFPHLIPGLPDRKDSHVRAVAQLASFPHGKRLQRPPPVRKLALAARVTDRKRPRAIQISGIHQVPQIHLVHRRGNCQVRYRAQVSQVKHSVMRRPVLAYKPRPVQAEDHVKSLQCRIMNHLIIRPLHKRRINIAKRNHPLFRQSCGKRYRMTLCNPHIKRPFGKPLHQKRHRASRRHGRRHTHHALVALGKFHQRMSKHILIQLRPVQVRAHHPLPRLLVKPPRRMPLRSRFLRRPEPFPLQRLHMKQLRTLHLLYIIQLPHKVQHIVPVHRPEITDIKTLKQIMLLRDQRLQTVIKPQDALPPVLRNQVHLAHHPVQIIPHLVIRLARCYINQVTANPPHIMVNSHIIIIQNNQQVIRIIRSIIQSFKRKSSRH